MEASVLFELVFDLAAMVDLMFWELFLWYLALKLGTTSFPGNSSELDLANCFGCCVVLMATEFSLRSRY